MYYPYPYKLYGYYPISGQGMAPEQTESTTKEKFPKPFLNHLDRKKEGMISVATPIEMIRGVLKGVFSDHIVVEVNDQNYHIRIEEIIYYI